MKKKDIPYQFTAMPLNLAACMDVNCRSMLFTLLQLSSYYSDEEGWFYRTNMDLQMQSRLSDKLVTEVISKFHRIGILEVQSVGQSKGKFPNRFRLNQHKFLEWEKNSLEECIKNPTLYIEKEDRKQKGWKPSYLTSKTVSSEVTDNCLEVFPNPHNIENTENVANTETVEKEEKKKENIDTNQGTLDEPYEEQSQRTEVERYLGNEDMYMRMLDFQSYNWRDWENILIHLDALMEKSPSPDLAETTYWKVHNILNKRVPYFQRKYEEDPDSEDAIDFENQLLEWASYYKGQSGAFSYFGDE